MKIARYKKAQKTLSFYKNNFGFREPYQILVDATFCQTALIVSSTSSFLRMPKHLYFIILV